MRTAEYTAIPSWVFNCPQCGADVEGPSGSLIWSAADVRQEYAKAINCECGTDFKLPESVVRQAKNSAD